MGIRARGARLAQPMSLRSGVLTPRGEAGGVSVWHLRLDRAPAPVSKSRTGLAIARYCIERAVRKKARRRGGASLSGLVEGIHTLKIWIVVQSNSGVGSATFFALAHVAHKASQRHR